MSDTDVYIHTGFPEIDERNSQPTLTKDQASLVIAKRFPRDEFKAESRILESCKRISLANSAIYGYPRGGEVVRGPSIRLAETMARYWGNIKYGFREIERNGNKSMAQAYCWDLETNTEVTRDFVVGHARDTKKGQKKLTAERDIYELIANYGQRRVRAAILEIIPGHIVEEAMKQCQKTLSEQGKNEPLIDRMRRCLKSFEKYGVNKDHIEERLKHPVEAINEEELFDLQIIFNSIKDGEKPRHEWFKINKPTTEGKAQEISEKYQKLA